MKRGVSHRSILMSIVITLTVLLAGCFGPPDDAIEAAIIEKHGSLSMKIYKLSDYEVTNSYTQDFGGDTVYVYEYTGNVVAASEAVARSGFKAADTISGTVSLVQRGDNWYSN